MYRDIFDTIMEDICDACNLLTEVKSSITSKDKNNNPYSKSVLERIREDEQESKALMLRLANS